MNRPRTFSGTGETKSDNYNEKFNGSPVQTAGVPSRAIPRARGCIHLRRTVFRGCLVAEGENTCVCLVHLVRVFTLVKGKAEQGSDTAFLCEDM